MDNVDFKKLVDQDDEFREYLKESLFQMLTAEKTAQALISAIYGFYQIGLTVDQVKQWHLNNVRMNNKEEDK